MNEALGEFLDPTQLVWLEQLGIGYYEARPQGVYDAAYFEKYRRMRDTPVGRNLNAFRVGLALAETGPGTLIDVGIGDGAFIDELGARRSAVAGFDVNDVAITWLRERGVWGELYGSEWSYATFWDSLEHIRDPRPALRQVREKILVSIPIFSCVEHVLSSRHFRPDEHFWYFTRDGFEIFLRRSGFAVTSVLTTETTLGRDGIETFVAERR